LPTIGVCSNLIIENIPPNFLVTVRGVETKKDYMNWSLGGVDRKIILQMKRDWTPENIQIICREKDRQPDTSSGQWKFRSIIKGHLLHGYKNFQISIPKISQNNDDIKSSIANKLSNISVIPNST